MLTTLVQSWQLWARAPVVPAVVAAAVFAPVAVAGLPAVVIFASPLMPGEAGKLQKKLILTFIPGENRYVFTDLKLKKLHVGGGSNRRERK